MVGSDFLGTFLADLTHQFVRIASVLRLRNGTESPLLDPAEEAIQRPIEQFGMSRAAVLRACNKTYKT